MCKKHNKNNKTKSRLYGFNRTLCSVCGHFAHKECAVKKIYHDYEEHVPEQEFLQQIEVTCDKHHTCILCNITDNSKQTMFTASKKKMIEDITDTNDH